MNGSVTLDFKDAACQRALSQALLKSDFALDVDFPVDRLVPAVPQRMNYILWLEDILSQNEGSVTGIDVGKSSVWQKTGFLMSEIFKQYPETIAICHRALMVSWRYSLR